MLVKFVNIAGTNISIMRRAAEEGKKAETSKLFELTPSIIYLLLYNGAQALGLVFRVNVTANCYPGSGEAD